MQKIKLKVYFDANIFEICGHEGSSKSSHGVCIMKKSCMDFLGGHKNNLLIPFPMSSLKYSIIAITVKGFTGDQADSEERCSPFCDYNSFQEVKQIYFEVYM